jgi:deoxycytidylate deaminase
MNGIRATIYLEQHPCGNCGGHRLLNREEVLAYSQAVDEAIDAVRHGGRSLHQRVGQEPEEQWCKHCPLCEVCSVECGLGSIELRSDPEPPIGEARTVEWFCSEVCFHTYYNPAETLDRLAGARRV